MSNLIKLHIRSKTDPSDDLYDVRGWAEITQEIKEALEAGTIKLEPMFIDRDGRLELIALSLVSAE